MEVWKGDRIKLKTIHFAIIGHGFVGHVHKEALLRSKWAKVTGISDRSPEMLEDVEAGIKKYKNNEELFSDPEVDVVIIAANNNQHHDLVIQAARAGKHIICEKPVAMNTAELEEMEAVIKECGVKFTVHQQRRWDKDYRIIKSVYNKKLLGDIYMMKNSLYGYNGNMHDWHVFASEGGGMLYDWGVHLIDQVLYMMPEAKVKSVYADMRNVINKEVDDYFKILLKFDNGIMAEIELGTYFLSDKIEENWYERHWIISGNQGTAYTDGFEPKGKIVRTSHLLTNVSLDKPLGAAGPTRSFGSPSEGTILTEELPDAGEINQDEYFYENFRKAYCGEEPFLVTIPEVKRVLKLMEAVWESARTGTMQHFE